MSIGGRFCAFIFLNSSSYRRRVPGCCFTEGSFPFLEPEIVLCLRFGRCILCVFFTGPLLSLVATQIMRFLFPEFYHTLSWHSIHSTTTAVPYASTSVMPGPISVAS